MNLKRLRQILKALADDTRLRILNVLFVKELSVSQLCEILRINQPSISKHLLRLRLLTLVNDRRDGNNMYYSFNMTIDCIKIILLIFNQETIEIKKFVQDKERMKKINCD
ncbi:ArsR/SmtB family transcription factor [Chlamydiota bacterium]